MVIIMNKLILILAFISISNSCQDQENKEINTAEGELYTQKQKAQIYTQQQEEIIDEYVYDCAQKYSYQFQHHQYQKCLDQGIKEDASISYLWQQKAMPYFKARKYEVGMRYLDKAVEINKVRYLSYRGFIHCIFAKNFHKAIEDFKKIKAIEGNSIVMDHSYNFYLGLSHLQLNNFEKAEQLFQQDVRDQVEEWGEKEYHHLAMFYLAVSKYEQKKWEIANQDFDKALEKYPTFSDAMYYKSICLYQLGKNEEYYTWYGKAKENGKAGNTINEDNSIYENYPYQILWN